MGEAKRWTHDQWGGEKSNARAVRDNGELMCIVNTGSADMVVDALNLRAALSGIRNVEALGELLEAVAAEHGDSNFNRECPICSAYRALYAPSEEKGL